MKSHLFFSKTTLLAMIGSIGCTLLVSSADARRAYDSSGSSSSSNSYATNQYTSPTTTNTGTSPSSQSPTPQANQYSPPQNQYSPPQNQYSPPPQNQYGWQQNQHRPPQNQGGYPYTTQNNGTNFYGISPEQLSGGPIQDTTYAARDGVRRGGYDPRWNPNFGTGAGAQVMARESGGLTQALRENFPLPVSGDEAQIFQVNDFAARSNGGMQNRPH